MTDIQDAQQRAPQPQQQELQASPKQPPPAQGTWRQSSMGGPFTGWSAGDLLSVPSGHRMSSTKLEDGVGLSRADRLAILVESTAFTTTTLIVICINAIWIGIDTEWNNSRLLEADGNLPLQPYSDVVENLFCIYFTVEVVLRFLAFKKKTKIYKDLWFIFDTTLVLLMILETWVFPIIEVLGGDEGSADLSNFSTLRILRLTRMVRMARSIGELRTLVRGMISAIRAVVSLLVFLVGLTYVFAIFFTTVLACAPGTCNDGWVHEIGDEEPLARYLFGSIGSSMMTLFTNGMLGDNLYWILTIIKNDSLIMYWLFCIYFLISALTLLNMLIGVLVDTISDTAEKENQANRELEFQECMARCFQEIDTDQSGTVTYMEWHEIKQDPTIRENLAENLMVHPDQVDSTMAKMEAVLFSHDGQQVGRNGVKHEKRTGSKEARISILDSCEPEEGLTRDEFVKLMVRLSPEKAATPIDVDLLRSVMLRFERQVLRAVATMKQQALALPPLILSRCGSAGASGNQRNNRISGSSSKAGGGGQRHDLPSPPPLHATPESPGTSDWPPRLEMDAEIEQLRAAAQVAPPGHGPDKPQKPADEPPRLPALPQSTATAGPAGSEAREVLQAMPTEFLTWMLRKRAKRLPHTQRAPQPHRATPTVSEADLLAFRGPFKPPPAVRRLSQQQEQQQVTVSEADLSAFRGPFKPPPTARRLSQQHDQQQQVTVSEADLSAFRGPFKPPPAMRRFSLQKDQQQQVTVSEADLRAFRGPFKPPTASR